MFINLKEVFINKELLEIKKNYYQEVVEYEREKLNKNFDE